MKKIYRVIVHNETHKCESHQELINFIRKQVKQNKKVSLRIEWKAVYNKSAKNLTGWKPDRVSMLDPYKEDVERMIKNFFPYRAIARKFGFNPATVRKFCIKNGFISHKSKVLFGCKMRSGSFDNKIKELADKGFKKIEIARKLNLDYGYVYYFLKRKNADIDNEPKQTQVVKPKTSVAKQSKKTMETVWFGAKKKG